MQPNQGLASVVFDYSVSAAQDKLPREIDPTQVGVQV
jgi:hypothetical protein